jgi:hypothetical protein
MSEEFLVLGCEAAHFDGNMATFWSNLLLSVMRVKGRSGFLRNVCKFLPTYGMSHPARRPSVHSALTIMRTFRSHENACSTDDEQNNLVFQYYVCLGISHVGCK